MMKTINIIVIILCVHFRYCQSLFFHKLPMTTVSGAQLVAQEKLKDIVLQCMEEEKSDPLHVYALFAFGAQNLPAKCVLRCVMHSCHLMDEEGHYDEQKMEKILKKTEPISKPQPSRFSYFGHHKASDNETLKECIDKDPKNDSCERAYVFTKCLQKRTQKSFNKLTDDFFNRASNDTFEIESIETTTASILSTLEAVSYNRTIVETDSNGTSSEANDDDTARGTGCNTTKGMENSNDTTTTTAIENSNDISAVRLENRNGTTSIGMENDNNDTATAGLENGSDTFVGIENGVEIYNAKNTSGNSPETNVDSVSIWKKVFSFPKTLYNFHKLWI